MFVRILIPDQPGVLVHSLSGSPAGSQQGFSFGAPPLPPGLSPGYPQPGSLSGLPQFISGPPIGSRLGVIPPPPPLAAAPSVLNCNAGLSSSPYKLPISFSPALHPISSSNSQPNSSRVFLSPPSATSTSSIGLLSGVAKSVPMDAGFTSLTSTVDVSLKTVLLPFVLDCISVYIFIVKSQRHMNPG